MKDIDFINKDIDRRISKYKYDNYLYHYTSISALHNILKSKQFWLGNTATMNDKKEVKYFIELLQGALRDSLPSDKLSQCDSFFQKVYARIDNEYPCAMCFSKLDDDAAQWERYVDNAEGVCIVFNTKNILCAFYEEHLLFGDVYYDFDIRQHQHYKILYDYFTTGKLNGFNQKEGSIPRSLLRNKLFQNVEEVI